MKFTDGIFSAFVLFWHFSWVLAHFELGREGKQEDNNKVTIWDWIVYGFLDFPFFNIFTLTLFSIF